MLRTLALIAAGTLMLPMPAMAQQDDDWARIRAEWNRPQAPFQLLGNIHYVGTAGLAAYLITTPEGHILIDAAMEESASQILANIRALGFRPGDVRILLVNHAHWDHSGGLAAIKRATGAQLWASAGDRPELESGTVPYRDEMFPAPPVEVDRVLRDGDPVTLGGVELRTLLTPGHTKGCTSWSMRTRAEGRAVDVLFACSLTVAGQDVTGDPRYPDAERDFRATFARLRGIKADVFLAFHGSAFGMDEKLARLSAGEALAFLDAGELPRRIEAAERGLDAELTRQRAARSTAPAPHRH